MIPSPLPYGTITMKSLSLRCAPLVAALGLLLASPAFADNTATGDVYANVPSTCEIYSIDPVTANFGVSVTQTSASGYINILCNLNAGYSLTAPTVDASGNFTITAISGTSGATMLVKLRESTTGNAWTSSDIVGGNGTGQFQQYPFTLDFNVAGGLPSYGSYVGSFDVTLAAH